LAKRAKNQDILQWALAGARERLAALSQEMERIYGTFPALRSGRHVQSAASSASSPRSTRRKRRRISAAGRAKLRAAAKRRWAAAKKAGKTRLG